MSKIGLLNKCENEWPGQQSTKPVPTIRVREGLAYLLLGIIPRDRTLFVISVWPLTDIALVPTRSRPRDMGAVRHVF